MNIVYQTTTLRWPVLFKLPLIEVNNLPTSCCLQNYCWLPTTKGTRPSAVIDIDPEWTCPKQWGGHSSKNANTEFLCGTAIFMYKKDIYEVTGMSSLHNQRHECWCPGDLSRQGINTHDIDLVIMEYSITHGKEFTPSCHGNMWVFLTALQQP